MKQPVALEDGVAKEAGQKPDVINNGEGVEVYKKFAFGNVFGQPEILGGL